GTQAYLANWDAGLVLLDISDVTDPQVVSVAIDPTSEDGEVNSHSVWPSEDGTIVVEGEEDFAPFEVEFTIDTGPFAGDVFPAAEGAITALIGFLPGGVMSGPTVYVGFGCEGSVFDPVPPFDLPMPAATDPSQLALIQRGGCFFSEKINNAEDAGYAGVVVFNDAARGDALVTMGGSPTNLPGVFVGHSTGLKIAGVADATELVLGATGEDVTVTATPDGWSGLRIWDYEDPTAPILASTFNTVCSADPIAAICDQAGTYSSHNVIVETDADDTVKAYVSWYSDGVLILDVSDPYHPVELGRYSRSDRGFIKKNAGPQDVWGVYKVPSEPWIYASDRSGGLYIVKELASGKPHGKR
ncbi:MAG: LVIVD repeat-containing protein, partial [Acidimicrobiia bacterium]